MINPPVQPELENTLGLGGVGALFTIEEADSWAAEFKRRMAEDLDPAVQHKLEHSQVARDMHRWGGWFQRVELPEHGFATTSDHERYQHAKPGKLLRYGDRLTDLEGAVFRPQQKWNYLERHIPDLANKTVLEVGSSNGCFSLQLAGMGAKHVTGIEALDTQVDQARWAAETLGLSNTTFACTDFLSDRSLVEHDVVFLSEVHNHFPTPFLGLLRLVDLAAETLILDCSGSITNQKDRAYFHVAKNEQTGAVEFVHWTISENLLVSFLDLAGVPPHRIRAYRSPIVATHVLYVIDTSHKTQDRAQRAYPKYLQKSVLGHS